MDNLPIITVSQSVERKMRAWTDIAPGEVSGLGLGKAWSENGRIHFHADYLELLEQECTSGHTEIDDQAVADFIMRAAEEDRDNDVRFWWHSHVDMNCYWSQTDTKNIDSIRPPGFFLSIVTNKEEEERVRLDYKPEVPDEDDPSKDLIEERQVEFHFDDLDYEVKNRYQYDDLKEEYNEKVTEINNRAKAGKSHDKIHRGRRRHGGYWKDRFKNNNDDEEGGIEDKTTFKSRKEGVDPKSEETYIPGFPRGEMEIQNNMVPENVMEFFHGDDAQVVQDGDEEQVLREVTEIYREMEGYDVEMESNDDTVIRTPDGKYISLSEYIEQYKKGERGILAPVD